MVHLRPFDASLLLAASGGSPCRQSSGRCRSVGVTGASVPAERLKGASGGSFSETDPLHRPDSRGRGKLTRARCELVSEWIRRHSRARTPRRARATIPPMVVSALCSYTHLDANGLRWAWNFSAMASPSADYEMSASGFRIALNICQPPVSACRPPGLAPPPQGTPAAIKFWGPTPSCTTAPASRCATQACAHLAWGALGGMATRWSLIDPAEPSEGIRLTHYSLSATPPLPVFNRTAAGPGTPSPASSVSSAPLDEYGQPRPSLLTVDLVCEPTAPLPAAPLQMITITGQQPGDTTLKLRSPAACPTHAAACSAGSAGEPSTATPAAGPLALPPATASMAMSPMSYTASPPKPAAQIMPGGSGPAVSPPTVEARPSGGLNWLAAFLTAGILGVLLFLGFAPMSLRERLNARINSAFATDGMEAWPVAVAGDEEDESTLGAGGPRVLSGRRLNGQRLEMDYRAM